MAQQKISRKLAQVKKDTLHVGVNLGSENNVAVGINEYAERFDRFRFPIPVMQESGARIMDEIMTPIPVNFGEFLENKISN